MLRQFVQNKFVQEFVAVLLLLKKTSKALLENNQTTTKIMITVYEIS